MENQIRAVYTEKSIRVYQAFNKVIAQEAIPKGTFGENFKLDRMTWIKPSFLWMMYRCGWGTKENQEYILAIDVKRDAFDYLVKNAILSSYHESNMSYSEWKSLVQSSDIRMQWDPERDIHGNPLEHRSLQLGIRGEMVKKYVADWIENITDITDYVEEIRMEISMQKDVLGLLPNERVYHLR